MKKRLQESLCSIMGAICLGALLLGGCVSVDGMRENLKTSTGDDLKDAQEELCSIVAGHSQADSFNGDTLEEKLQFLDLAKGDQQLLLKILFKMIEESKRSHYSKTLKSGYSEGRWVEMLSQILDRLDTKSPEVVKGLLDFAYETYGVLDKYRRTNYLSPMALYIPILYEKLLQCDFHNKDIKEYILNSLNSGKYCNAGGLDIYSNEKYAIMPGWFFHLLFKGISLTDDKAFWAYYFQGAPYTAIKKYYALASLDEMIDFHMMVEDPWHSNVSKSSEECQFIARELSWISNSEGGQRQFIVEYSTYEGWNKKVEELVEYAERYPSIKKLVDENYSPSVVNSLGRQTYDLKNENQLKVINVEYPIYKRMAELNIVEIDDETLLKILYFGEGSISWNEFQDGGMIKTAKQEWIKRKWDKNSATLEKMLSDAIAQKEPKKKLGKLIALLKRYDSSLNEFEHSLTLKIELPRFEKSKGADYSLVEDLNRHRFDIYKGFRQGFNDQLHKLFAESSLKLTDAELAALFCRDARFYTLLNKLVTSKAMYLALKSNKLAKDLELKLVESIEPVKIDMVLYNSVKDANIKKALYKRMPRANRKAMDKGILAKIRKDAQKASGTTFVLDGFYLGMPIEDAKLVFEYAFPNISIKEDVRDEKKELSIDGQDSPFCLAKEDGKVYQFDFGRRLLEKWYKYQTQDVTMWSLKYGKEHRLDFSAETMEENDRICYFNIYGDAIRGSWSANVLEHKNYDKAYKLTLFVREYYVLDTQMAKGSLKEKLRGARAEGGTLRVEKMNN